MRAPALATLCLLAISACDAADDPAPAVADVTVALRSTSPYHWDGGLGHPVLLMPATEGFCYLTGVSGRFVGDDTRVSIFVAGDNNWYLDGASGSGNTAEAMCVHWSEMGALAGRDISETISVRAQPSPSDNVGVAEMRGRHHFCYLTGVEGALAQTDGYVDIEPGFGPWRLTAKSGVSFLPYKPVRASASCVTVGQPDDIVYSREDGSAYQWRSGQLALTMSRTRDSFCYLTGLRGSFEHAPSVHIAAQGDFWVLSGDGGTVEDPIRARARCVPLVQNIPGRVIDPGFEDTQGELPYPWDYDLQVAAERGTGCATSGLACAHMTSPAANPFGPYIMQRVTVKPHTSYTLSAMIRTVGLSHQEGYLLAGELAETDFGSPGCVGFHCCVGCAAAYSRRSVTFDSGGRSQISIGIGMNPQNPAEMFVDDVRLTEN